MQDIAVSIGIFDGVHRGHQKILKRLVLEAKKLKAKSLVVTFHPHPRRVLNPSEKIPFLISLAHRRKLIKQSGVDLLTVVKFTKALSRMKAEDFIKHILLRRFKIKTLVVGENFLFGHKGKGDFAALKKMSRKYGFRLAGIKPVKAGGDHVSSTRIRRAIEKGLLKEASFMMARPVAVLGTVVKGRRLGRTIGFPTANIDPHHEAIPPSGVYAVGVIVNKKSYSGVLNIGTRPTFDRDKEPVMELHILHFKKDIYNKDVEIIFKRKIRNEKKFRSIEALRKQILRDISRVE